MNVLMSQALIEIAIIALHLHLQISGWLQMYMYSLVKKFYTKLLPMSLSFSPLTAHQLQDVYPIRISLSTHFWYYYHPTSKEINLRFLLMTWFYCAIADNKNHQ
jgi:hypothetical protein